MKCYTITETFDVNFDNRIPNEDAYVANFSNKEDLYTVFLKFLEHYHCLVDGKIALYDWDCGDFIYEDPREEFESMLGDGHSYPYQDENSPMGWGFLFLRQEEINENTKIELPWD